MLERPYMALALILDNGLWQARGRATTMPAVTTTRNVTSLDTARGRERRIARAREARSRHDAAAVGGGRAWINGREVGGSDARFAHLGRSHD